MSSEFFKETKDGFTISTDKSKLDFDVIFDYLSNRSYWAAGVPMDKVKRAADNSICFGVYENDRQIGYARVVTDKATIGYIADVFILETHRGRGLSKWLMECILKHPELQGFRRWVLLTKDAHGLYKQFGFTEPEDISLYMELRKKEITKTE
jgi:N-acetylglutamate synthase-like GNAT family acetyltransferase